MSPLAAAAAQTEVGQIITITAEALQELVKLRDSEPEGDRLGLRLEIVSNPGEDFKYDLSFDIVTKAAFSDEVRTTSVPRSAASRSSSPASAIDLLEGATLDHTATQGLVIRNPNKPKAPSVEGLIVQRRAQRRGRGVDQGEVNPALAAHGGFVTYVGHDGEGTAYLTMGGGCHGCSMSRMTMLDGVQTMLVEQIPEIERVRDLTDHASGENPYYH